jgi:Predicted ornithine cyclodeaminase, mu-crystallin homolog
MNMPHLAQHRPAVHYYSRLEMQRLGVRFDPAEVQAVADRAWFDIRDERTYGLKSVLAMREAELWSDPDLAHLRSAFSDERLGWKLSSLAAANPCYAGVKVIGANALNRHFDKPRSTSTFLLLDKVGLYPLCLMDSTELSAARTATYPVLVSDLFLGEETEPYDVFLFGAGPISEKIIIGLGVNRSKRIRRVYIRSRTEESSRRLSRSLKDKVPFPLIAVAGNERAVECRLVITASNANAPVFEVDDLAPDVVLLHLGGDECPAAFIRQALRRGTVVCDDIHIVATRGSQSLPLYFTRRGSNLEDAASLFGISNLAIIRAAQSCDYPSPVFVTCVGIPMLDLYLAQHVYEKYLKEMPASDRWS